MDEVSPFEPTVVSAVSRHWRFVLAVALVFAIPAGIFALTRPSTYKASASLTVSDPRQQGVLGGQPPSEPERYVADQLAIFTSSTFGSRAAQRGLQQDPPLEHRGDWFLAHTTAAASAQTSNLITVTFSAPSAAEAIAGMRSAVSAYSDVVRSGVTRQATVVLGQLDGSIQALDAQLQALTGSAADPAVAGTIEQLTASRGELAARREVVKSEAALPGSGIGQLLLPRTATTTGKMAALRLILLAAIFGLLVGGTLAYVRAYRKRVFLHKRDPELVLAAPLLIDASILTGSELHGGAREADAPRVEAIAREMFAIGTSLVVDQRSSNSKRGLSLAVVSAHGGANCSAVAWRSAFAFASQGLRVVLIDVHGSRPPAQAWMTRIADDLVWEQHTDGRLSLSNPSSNRPSGQLLAGDSPAEPIAFTKQPPPRELYYCGEPPPVHSQSALAAAFRDLEDDFDVVLVNAPFFLPSADAAYLAAAAGTVLVVVPDGGSVTEHEELARRLELTSATAAGYVYCSAESDAPTPQPQPAPPASRERPKLTARARARAS